VKNPPLLKVGGGIAAAVVALVLLRAAVNKPSTPVSMNRDPKEILKVGFLPVT
jgi:hypothetical protein